MIRIGVYEVVEKIGEGGMGEVYRARDTKLGRDVALKILPAALSSDAERLSRLEREAKTLAALNHPHIAQIYGFEQSGDTSALVMELVQGEDLAERIRRGPLPLEEALPLARQIAEALHAAHSANIVHRDLKPANVKVRPDGTVKVLDFGLAKAVDQQSHPDQKSALLANSPTITSPAITSHGVILGTAPYMAPEQARGKAVDERADLWAFGCVLFEMLAGRRAFEGQDVTDTVAAILAKEPQWSSLPRDLPAPIRRLLRRCLQKDVSFRLASAADARLDLIDALNPDDAEPAALPARWPLVVSSVAILLAAVGMSAVWLTMPDRAESSTPARFVITPDDRHPLPLGPSRSVAVSPDGTFVVYASNLHLVVRRMNQTEPTMIATEGSPRSPMVSPDGQWVAFFTPGALRRVALAGGSSVAITPLNNTGGRGGVWLPDGTIVFAGPRGLMRVAAEGGEAKPIAIEFESPVDGDWIYESPAAMPGGQMIALGMQPRVRSNDGGGQIAVVDLETGRARTIVRGGNSPQYAGGFLFYVSRNALWAATFSPAGASTTGDPRLVLEGVESNGGIAQYSISPGGNLFYVQRARGTTGTEPANVRAMVWVTRNGTETPVGAPMRDYGAIGLSPDETRIAADIRDGFSNTIWTWDVRGARMTRLTIDPSSNDNPVWGADGARLFFRSDRDGVANVYVQRADGAGTAERVGRSPYPQLPKAATRAHVLFTEAVKPGAVHIKSLTLDGDAGPSVDVITTNFGNNNPAVSPDGRWLAYQSNESGQIEVYVRPYPDTSGGRWLVSNGGGSMPLWSRSGRELFYFDLEGRMTSVDVQSAAVFTPGNPKTLFDTRYASGSGARTYDVSRDGRFLMMKDLSAPDRGTNLVVVLDVFAQINGQASAK